MGEARDTLTVGQLAKRFGLNARTLRYYEEVGLLPAARSANGYRLYSELDAERLSFVLRAKQVGFTLDEIGEVLRLGRHGRACAYVRDTLARHIKAIDAQIAELEQVRAELQGLRADWQENNAPGGTLCGLIERVSLPSPRTNETKEVGMATSSTAIGKRQVEVFTAGCPLCDPVVELVQRIACDGCNVTVHDLRSNPEAAERLKAAGVERVPMVLVDGKPAECCSSSGAVTEEGLRAAGVGEG